MPPLIVYLPIYVYIIRNVQRDTPAAVLVEKENIQRKITKRFCKLVSLKLLKSNKRECG